MLRKQAVTLIVSLSLVSSTLYLPVFTPRAQAIFGVGDIVIDIKALARQLVDGYAMALAQEFIDQIVRESIDWANSGFEDSPVYATNPKRFFINTADNVAGQFIGGSELDYLCSPFRAQIRLSLVEHYIPPPQYQCSLTDVIDNIDNFYNDFNQGGWDAWFAVTQNSANNPYGAYFEAKLELDSRVAEAVGLQREELEWNQGFISTKDCIKRDPDTGECLDYGPTKTPGATIKAQLDRVLPSSLEKLITVNHIEQLISAVAVGLLKKFVFSDEGLFSGDQASRNSYFSDVRDGNRIIIEDAERDKCDSLREIGIVLDEDLDADCNPIFEPSPSDPGDPIAVPGLTDPPAFCSGSTLPAGTRTNWPGFFGQNWPSPIHAQKEFDIPRAGYYAIEFNTGNIVGSGGHATILNTATWGERLSAISQCPGDFSNHLPDLARECTHLTFIGGGIGYNTLPGDQERQCDLEANTTYWINVTFTDGVSETSDRCSGEVCRTTIQHSWSQ